MTPNRAIVTLAQVFTLAQGAATAAAILNEYVCVDKRERINAYADKTVWYPANKPYGPYFDSRMNCEMST